MRANGQSQAERANSTLHASNQQHVAGSEPGMKQTLRTATELSSKHSPQKLGGQQASVVENPAASANRHRFVNESLVATSMGNGIRAPLHFSVKELRLCSAEGGWGLVDRVNQSHLATPLTSSFRHIQEHSGAHFQAQVALVPGMRLQR